MKTLKLRALVLLLATCAFIIAPARLTRAGEMPSAATQVPETGSLVLTCSPVLPDYIGLVVNIDGQLAGAFTKGHVFKRSIAPGSHRIYVSERGRLITAFDGTLDVRPGRTYSYSVKFSVNQVVLEPNDASPEIASQ